MWETYLHVSNAEESHKVKKLVLEHMTKCTQDKRLAVWCTFESQGQPPCKARYVWITALPTANFYAPPPMLRRKLGTEPVRFWNLYTWQGPVLAWTQSILQEAPLPEEAQQRTL